MSRFVSSFTDGRDCGRVLVSHFSLLLGMAGPIWITAVCMQSQGGMVRQGDTGDTGDTSYPGAGATSAIMQPAWPVNTMVNTMMDSVPPRITYTTNFIAAAFHTVQIMWDGITTPSWYNKVWSLGALPAMQHATTAIPAFAGMLCVGVCDTVACVVGRLFGRTRIHVGAHKTVEGMLVGALVGAGCLLVLMAGGCLAGVLHVANAWSEWLVVVDVGVALLLTSFLEAVTLQLDNIALPLHCYSLLCCVVARLL